MSADQSDYFKHSRDWRERLSNSRKLGYGFAAPGGEFTKALYEWSFTPRGGVLKSLLSGRRVIELGAVMMSYGYALADVCGAKNFVAVEPFYSDIQKTSIQSYISGKASDAQRIPFKVSSMGMLEYLESEPDDLLCIIACGIEDCILPGPDYRRKVERQILRTMEKDTFFLSSHSDLYPNELKVFEQMFARPSNKDVNDRLRLHGSQDAVDKFGSELYLAGFDCDFLPTIKTI